MADPPNLHSPGVYTLTDALVEEGALNHPGLLLLDVWADWCGPCRLMAPMMDWAATTYGDRLRVAKLEADPNPRTLNELDVKGLPTLILFQSGKEIDRHEGAIPQSQLKAFLDKHF
ncbi:MAG: thioredoxin family protein [Cyanobacteriota bacterium]